MYISKIFEKTNGQIFNIKVSILLLNYKNSEDTIRCLKTIEELNYKNFEVLIFDNASEQDQVFLLKNYLKNMNNPKNIRYYYSKYNLGFSKANNYLVEKSNGELIWFLNNDTIVEKNSLKVLVKIYKKYQNAGTVSCTIPFMQKPEIVWSAGCIYYRGISLVRSIGKFQSIKKWSKKDTLLKVDFNTGCALLIKRTIFDKVGRFNEEYFVYNEDLELGLKIKELGLDNIVLLCPLVLHDESASTKGKRSSEKEKWSYTKIYLMLKTRLIFLSKNGLSIKNILISLSFLFIHFFLFFYYSKEKNILCLGKIFRRAINDSRLFKT
ncbi:MAG: glycosyltransferase family 2 protein [Candidatus Heimdallarchaeum aukensis]|uniref:Glycosyltransferase family 2 protein n=1 Tax=Candidatus Heimdallarchaeum aukensis TaxID=2876573 RepID=A0A9Y1BM77_9ARCH|nr:MAG: glycosyltransferase family 2 protein [Candidatus Heimdallarchaeum aukensis]